VLIAFCIFQAYHTRETTFLKLFTKKNSIDKTPQEFLLTSETMTDSIKKLQSENYLCWTRRNDCTSYFIIHGFNANSNAKWVQQLRDEFFLRHSTSGLINVFTVDWPTSILNVNADEGINLNSYKNDVEVTLPQSVLDLKELTLNLIELKYLQSNESTLFLHCIGHSLGAHFCGLFGKQLSSSMQIKPRRITGLDPAGPLFDRKERTKRLDRGDALFVDIIHTNNFGFGLAKSVGDVDFYPNGGSEQPGCGRSASSSILINLASLLASDLMNNLCNHNRAYELFTSSLNKCKFNAYECYDYSCFLNGNSDYKNSNLMGLDAITKEEPYNYYLETRAAYPFCFETTCTYQKKQGYCAYGKEKKGECYKLNDKSCGTNNRYWCCLERKEKLIEKDLTLVIDTSSRSSEEFQKAINFLASVIKSSEINQESTRLAIIDYSSATTQTRTYLKQDNSQQYLLNVINSIPIDMIGPNTKRPSSPHLIDALKQCQNVYKLENGMRDLSKGIDKQVIFISGDELSKNEQAVQIVKQLGDQGKAYICINLKNFFRIKKQTKFFKRCECSEYFA